MNVDTYKLNQYDTNIAMYFTYLHLSKLHYQINQQNAFRKNEQSCIYEVDIIRKH